MILGLLQLALKRKEEFLERAISGATTVRAGNGFLPPPSPPPHPPLPAPRTRTLGAEMLDIGLIKLLPLKGFL